MKVLRSLFLSAWFLLLHNHFATCDQKVLSPQARLRSATLDDADDIATIVMAAFEPMPDWQYFRQFRHDFPNGHRECVRFGITQMLRDPNTNAEVIEAPQDSQIPLVAVAIWSQTPASSSHSEQTPPCKNPETTRNQSKLTQCISVGCYQSLNVTRTLDYVRKFNAAEKQYVFDVFGKRQVYLYELAAHPDYQLRGAGTRLVKRGIERGRRENVNVTLIAQPTAEGFYFKKGFKEMRNISVDSVDGDERFGYNVMAYEFEDGS